MAENQIDTLSGSGGPSRKPWAVGLILLATLVLGGLLVIPFYYESPSIWYKFGLDKILLRSGKMVGLTAAFGLLLQLPLAGRLKWLDRIFSLPLLYRIHRINGYGLGLMVLVHPVLVFAPDGILMIPFERRYWPQWVGAGLVLVIVSQILVSRFRPFFFKTYLQWQRMHRIMGSAAMVLVILHILFVSETFEHTGLPRTLILISGGLMTGLWLWIRTRPAWARKSPFRLIRIEPAGKDAYTLGLEPTYANKLKYLPGQFAFLTFHAKGISKESHPFTLSSTPSRPQEVQFTIRCCGDWTDRIGTLRKGDQAFVQGPFGHFSHLLLAPHKEVVFIAGGIGITPMLSMLRHMVDTRFQHPVTLLWSNRTKAHLFCRAEIDAMVQQLTAFRWIPIFTREQTAEGQFGRLDRTMLSALLKKNSRQAAVFVCGPPQMIQKIEADLKLIGFSSRCIHTEAFGF